jgi:iron complex outermembrane receptor protein
MTVFVLAATQHTASAAELEEIVVTAQKREQNLQDVGITVNVMTGDDLKDNRISQPMDLASRIPNVDIKTPVVVGNPVITIRGVGLNDFNVNNNPTAGVYVDEVFLTSTAMMSFQLFDLDRVEVLKGPQGTLYGRNTTAGAINFVTKRPTDEFEMYVSGTVGNYKLGELEAAVGGPLSDSVRYRLSAKTTQQNEGIYTLRTFDNADHGKVDVVTWRAQLAFDLSDNATLDISVHGDRDKSEAGLFEHYGALEAPFDFTLCQAVAEGRADQDGCVDFFGYQDTDGDPYSGDWNMQPIIDRKSLGGRIALNWDIGDVTLTSITGYETLDRFAQEGDEDASPLTILHISYDDDVKQFSQELRLASSNDRLDWIAGVFYSDDTVENMTLNELPDFLATNVTSEIKQDTRAFAVFGHTEWTLSDQWRLIAGLRYTKETKDAVANSTDQDPFGTSLILGGAVLGPFVLSSVNDSIDDTNLSGKIGLEFAPGDDWLWYANVSRGFKSGGFFGGFAFSDEEYAPFEPEEIIAYEAGFKGRLLDNGLQWNAAMFYYDYQDVQAFVQVPGQLPILRLQNIPGKSKVAGLDMDLWWRPGDGLDIKLGAGFTDTELADFETADGILRSGNEMANAPRFTMNASLRYEWNVGSNLSMSAMANGNYSDEVFKDTTNDPLFKVDSYTVLDARLALGDRDGKWEIAGWAKNLTDEQYVVDSFGDTGFLGSYLRLWNTPRTYGVTFSYFWQ